MVSNKRIKPEISPNSNVAHRNFNTPSIVGVCLVKNEQNFIPWVLMNAVDFCDKILVLDNLSEDRTMEIVSHIATRYKHIEVIPVRNCNDTHKFVEEYAGTSTWILKIDGDEILDPVGLGLLREDILAGVYDKFWQLTSSMLHVVGINFEQAKACGFNILKQGTGLSNFNAIESWHGRSERLHGGNIIFRSGYSENLNYLAPNWTTAKFRTLHMCFMPRSPIDLPTFKSSELDGRNNPREKQLIKQIKRRLFKNFYANKPSFKKKNYTSENFEVVDITNFGRPDDFRIIDPECDSVVELLRNITYERKHIEQSYTSNQLHKFNYAFYRK